MPIFRVEKNNGYAVMSNHHLRNKELTLKAKGLLSQKTNAMAFAAAVRKYTDMQELDATVLREFIERIEASHVEKGASTREITIVYNFIGAFDFNRAIEEAQNTTLKTQRTA